MVAAMLLPAMILLTGVLVPMGAVSEEMLYTKASSLVGKLVLFVLIFLPLFHAAHRLKHTLHDMGIHLGALGAPIFYGGSFAAAGLAAFFLFL